MVSRLEGLCRPDCVDEMSASSRLGLNSLGRICGTGPGRDAPVLARAKGKNSVRRMSVIEDGRVAEVLYLIPKRCVMEQLPLLNPHDYVLCEKLAAIPADVSGTRRRTLCFLENGGGGALSFVSFNCILFHGNFR